MNPHDFFSLLNEPARARLPALRTVAHAVDHAALLSRIEARAQVLAAHGARVVASLMDNGADWIVHDLACLKAGVVHVPLPLFFTPGQWRDTLNAAGVNVVVGPASIQPLLQAFGFEALESLPDTSVLFRRAVAAVALPARTAKITFTSGSTGSPKGVCLGAQEMLAVAASLAEATRPLGIVRHLSALPLPVLLENIAGVYSPLIEGAAVCVRPLNEVGLQGSSRFDPAVFHRALMDADAQSVIVLPQMLRAYAGWLHATATRAPAALRLMAVGGAAVGKGLLDAARALGLPAYEGYGLSEACSVQTLNLPGAERNGSCGRPLPHAKVRVAPDGEIEIAGTHALGYLGELTAPREWLATGDLGHLDEAGFLHVQGRKKNVLITGFGRNVSPEWIELALGGQACIAQAVVLGEGQPELGAVIWPLGDVDDATLQAAIDRVNTTLPDYARIGRWVRARAEFSAASGLSTPNGRARRAAVAALHADLFSRTSAQPLA
ncbi:long-chain acyl-CoA synthetase [Achromobacter spanius]|uniref:Long-chain acyl-CoA synthetase n=1 Tax=Achromobacter spanius TaxID=217203 RepID=A0A2S5GYZ3_9BURK|nr:AMP-binding protein [Achromobacter spanius]PPA78174.1 long-chain acyl-CoA synthetase [Achromobacter spanius]